MIEVAVFDLNTGAVSWTVGVDSTADAELQRGVLPAGFGLAIDVKADPETQMIEGRDTDTPYAAPRPALAVSATEASADGTDAVTVAIPADAAPVEVVVDGVVQDTWSSGPQTLGANAPCTVELRPQFPFFSAQVKFI